MCPRRHEVVSRSAADAGPSFTLRALHALSRAKYAYLQLAQVAAEVFGSAARSRHPLPTDDGSKTSWTPTNLRAQCASPWLSLAPQRADCSLDHRFSSR